MFKRLSLRLRLTLLMATMLAVMLALLTASSINRAVDYLVPDNYLVKVYEPVQYGLEGEKGLALSNVEMQSIATTKIDSEAVAVTMDEAETALSWQTVAGEPPAVSVLPVEKLTLTVAARKEFASASTAMMLLTIFAGVALTWIMAGRALRPVQDLADTIDAIDAHNLSARIADSPAQDEIHRLTESFNHMLDKLEEAFRQQSRFAANAAHELKTPLAAMQANLEILALEEQPTFADYRETLDVINRQTNRLTALVANLLLLHDKAQSNLQETIITETLIEYLLDEQATAIAEKQLTVTVNNELPKLYGNKALLASALGNLLDNAVKYQHFAGHIRLTLWQEEGQTLISVWDDGPGIAKEQIAHIFEPFYRCDLSHSNKVNGSGLGLSLVQMIAGRHGGTVTVSSTASEGTVFTIILPAAL